MIGKNPGGETGHSLSLMTQAMTQTSALGQEKVQNALLFSLFFVLCCTFMKGSVGEILWFPQITIDHMPLSLLPLFQPLSFTEMAKRDYARDDHK